MAEQAANDIFHSDPVPQGGLPKLVTVVTPLWDQAGHLCGSAAICQHRADWQQIEQAARECEAPVASLFKYG